MNLDGLLYSGPEITDEAVLAKVTKSLAGLLRQKNGFIAFYGGLHIRGACAAPAWHSLAAAWSGERAIHRLFPAVKPEDVPFGEDYLGDQLLLRDRRVWKLSAETGLLEDSKLDFNDFLRAAEAKPKEFLALGPLLRYYKEGGKKLAPGQILQAYPPFCTKEAANGVSLRAVDALEGIAYLADLARKIGRLPDGARVEVRVTK